MRGGRGPGPLPLWAVGAAVALLAASTCSCDGRSASDTAEATAARTNSLPTAKSQAQVFADDTAMAAFPGQKYEQTWLDDQHCDPPGAGLVNAEYTLKFKVPPDQVDAGALAAWAQLEQLGFGLDGGAEPGTGGAYGSHPRGKLGKYRGAIDGNRVDSVVYVSIVTPCLKPSS